MGTFSDDGKWRPSLTDRIEDNFFLFFGAILLGVIAFMAVIGVPIVGGVIWFESSQCARTSQRLEVPSKYDWLQATCYIQVNGQWVDQERYLVNQPVEAR